MSQFDPTPRITQPDNEPDRLAGGVLNSLTRPMFRRLSWSVARMFVLTWLTFGILPLVVMIGWLRSIVAASELQFWHLAEWMRLQNGDSDATELQKASQRVRFSLPLALVEALFLLIAVGAAAMHFTGAQFSLARLYRFAYHLPASPEAILFALAISAAAVCHWVHLAWHQQNIERFLRWFNQLAARQGIDQIPLPGLELGLRPTWLLGGLALVIGGGAIWALPVMLAGGAHRRYIIDSSPRVRAALAERLRMMLIQRRPIMRIPRPIVYVRTCIRPNCRAALPTDACFCPRCGTRAAGQRMNVVA